MYAWYNKGVALSNLGRFADALAAYKQALVLDPKYANAWNGMGYVYRAMGKPLEGLRLVERAIELAPPPHEGSFWDSKGDMLLDLERLQEALEAYEHALTLAVSWRNKANVLRRLGHTADADAAEQHAKELGG